LKKRGISVEDFLKGQAGLDYGEEGEEDIYGEEDSGEEDPEEGAAEKRQK
jgi:hypothetical protein